MKIDRLDSQSLATLSAATDAPAGATGPAIPPAMPAIITAEPYDENRRLAFRLATLTRPAVAIPLILLVGAMLFLVNLGAAPIYTKGEAREAVTIFDILHGGGVILPMRAGVEIPSKPLMMHWLAALISLAAGGISAWTVRMPSALLAIAGALACYLYVRRLFEARSALLAALILLTCGQYLQAGTGSRVDMTLTFFLTIAFFEFLMFAEGFRSQPVFLYLAIALAVLTKGPVGAVLPALVAIIWIIAFSRWSLLRRIQFLRGALIIGILGGGWYLLAIAVGGSAFIHKQILAENLYRLTGHPGVNEGHVHPFYYEDAALLAGFMPWTPVALIALVQAIRRPRRLEPRLGYLLIWVLTVLIFYNLPESKRGVYLLALYPALAAIIGLFLGDAITYPEFTAWTSRMLARFNGAAFVIIGACAFLGLGLIYFSPATLNRILAPIQIIVAALPLALRAKASHFLPIAISLPAIIIAIGFFLLRSRPRADKLVLAITGSMVAIALAVNLVVQPALADSLTVKNFAASVNRTAAGAPVGFFGTVDYAFAFYSGRNLDLINDRDHDPPPYIVSTEDALRLMPLAMRSQYVVVLTSHPTALNGSGIMYLLHRTAAANSSARPST
ncbi:MAG TPA: glycosyltransferase family 39 protein [Candidatus Binataceae bacterium]|nr:glycosyltransferase family 39 protein [Candidatus Binataceae bacterium]